MKINKKTVQRINQDFKNLSCEIWKRDYLLKTHEKKLTIFKPVDYIFTKVFDCVHNLNWIFSYHLKKNNEYENYCLKVACKVFASGAESDYWIRKEIKRIVKNDIENFKKVSDKKIV
ncbi:hypothetical protein V6727_09135 [Campylobacter coli]|uniref:hypothetical protein n=1 Tax=Campylobacter coli TaxID=195 RepID=UPI002FF1A6CA